MKLMRVVVVFVAFVSIVYLAGCCGGSSTTVEREKVIVPVQSSEPTLGKELEDLENAYKKGVINQQEYEAAKNRLINKGTQGK